MLDAVGKAGAGFRSLADSWADTTTPHGRLTLVVLGGLAEFERGLIRARTEEGRKRAQARGVRFGRELKLTPHQRQEAIARREAGKRCRRLIAATTSAIPPSRGLPDARLRLLVDDETFLMATAHRAHQVPPTAPFVWSEIGPDAGETPEHIIIRKEAERVAGAGEFWWGLGASLGVSVEVMAQRNGGTLPALFSKSKGIETQQNSEVRIWNAWRSVLHPDQQGRIPGHIIVTSGHDPKKRQTRFALICRSAVELALGTVGFCELDQCRTVRGGRQRVDALRGAQLLTKREPLISPHGSPSQSVYRIAFKATLVGHCYVQLENSRALTQAELNNLLQFQPGDDWLSLVKKLRP